MNSQRPRRFRKFFFIVPIAVAAAALLGWAVMSLWNGLMPPLFGLKLVTYWQAIGLMILFRLLFGSFGGPRGRGHGRCRGAMRERWEQMTPQERQQLRQRMQAYCQAPPSDSTPAA
jgi:hypothetical protein